MARLASMSDDQRTKVINSAIDILRTQNADWEAEAEVRRIMGVIRMRLGGSPDPFGPVPEKPRGMWKRTYERHCEALARIERSLNFLAR
jgi:hypothetical protein